MADKDLSDDSSEEETFEEGFLDSIAMTGVLERKKDDKQQKYYWYLLTGSSLYEYRTVKVNFIFNFS